MRTRPENEKGHGPLGGVRGLEETKVYREILPDRLPTTDETAAAYTRRRARGAATTAAATGVAGG
ncbi:hypothetical protein, partial [Rhodococcus rhodochrous]|uniref:hypothetical protein n=1 Tax=Rhodococcus rhodochrous TaxID=1829 RepID=UPI001E3BAB9C